VMAITATSPAIIRFFMVSPVFELRLMN